jgi:hypothetical protein
MKYQSWVRSEVARALQELHELGKKLLNKYVGRSRVDPMQDAPKGLDYCFLERISILLLFLIILLRKLNGSLKGKFVE